MGDHTPGPWHIGDIHGHKGSYGPNCKQSIHAGPRGVVAVVFGAQERIWKDGQYVSAPIDSPNARLIAAAPDLLSALKQQVRDCWSRSRVGYEDHEEGCVHCENARAAIAKAEGRSK